MGQNVRCRGMIPIDINGSAYIATQLQFQKEYDMQSFGGTNFVSSISTNGSMLLFCQSKIPPFYRKNGVPEFVTMDWRAGDSIFHAEDVLFSKQRTLSGYEKCDAAYVEFMAKKLSVKEIGKSINTKVRI